MNYTEKRPSQDSIVLRTLTAAAGQWVAGIQLATLAGSMAVHSRAASLRAQGYLIDCMVKTAPNGQRHSYYRLQTLAATPAPDYDPETVAFRESKTT